MEQDTLLPFDLPGVGRKKVSVAFDGGLLSSDGGVLLLRGVERRLRIAERLSACMADRRDPVSLLQIQSAEAEPALRQLSGQYAYRPLILTFVRTLLKWRGWNKR